MITREGRERERERDYTYEFLYTIIIHHTLLSLNENATNIKFYNMQILPRVE